MTASQKGTPKPGWTVPEVARLRAMAAEGRCAQEIADALGRSKFAVHHKAKGVGVRLPYPSGQNFKGTTLPDYYIKAVRLLKESGLTAPQISRIFKYQHRISATYVRRICAGESRPDV